MEPVDTGRGCDSFEMLALFLTPYDGYELWLDKFLKLWDTYYNPGWSSEVMNLLGPTARNNIGKIDWEPSMPTIFTRIIRALELPVTYKNMTSTRNQHFTLCSAARKSINHSVPLHDDKPLINLFQCGSCLCSAPTARRRTT